MRFILSSREDSYYSSPFLPILRSPQFLLTLMEKKKKKKPPQTHDIRREQGRSNYQSLFFRMTIHSWGHRSHSLINFWTDTEWGMPRFNWCFQVIESSGVRLCLNFFQTTSGSGVMFRKPLYLAFSKTNKQKKNPSLFLDNPIQEKITLTGHFVFLSCLYRVFININKFVYLSQTCGHFVHLNIIFMRESRYFFKSCFCCISKCIDTTEMYI